MGLRKKPRSTKAESQVDELRPPLSKGSAAAVHKEEPGEDDDYFDKDTDPEMQEVYVQAYSCQVFRDDAAAQAVEDGAHLRPLAMPQDPEGEPLMLDRFDARWMLDIADFSKGTGANIPAALSEEERKADVLRFSGLPKSDHSVFVEELGTFAPTGSYAHDRQGGLGGDKEELPEVYGYYGRTASPPRAARGAWSSTPAYQTPVDDIEIPSDVVETERHEKGKGDEGFVPDFAVPAGVLVPSSVRQHLMMVSTARNAVRSPQLEVLLRLKQASNAAFSFLSHEDPIHPYYVFLKSWGEAALALEYERRQRLQVDKRKEEKENAGAEEATTVTAKESSSLVWPPAADGTNSRGTPNLLGGAYDSSGDEEEQENDHEAEARSFTVASTPSTKVEVVSDPKRAEAVPVCVGGEEGVSDVTPAKKLVVDKMVMFVSRNGEAFEDRVREREKLNPAFDFLSPRNKYHAYYKKRLAEARGQTLVPPTAASSVAQEHSTNVGNPRVSPTRASDVGSRVTADSVDRKGVVSEKRGSASARDNGSAGGGMNIVGRSVGTASAVTAVGRDHAQVANISTAEESRIKGEIPRSRSRVRSDGLEVVGDVPGLIARSGQPEAASRSENIDHVGRAQKVMMEVQSSTAMPRLGVVEEDVVALATSAAGIVDGDGDEDPETRRANRLKRARLMKGHYKLAVLHQSSGGETADDGQQKQRGGSPSKAALLDTRPVPKEIKVDVDYLSADGISDLDDDDHDAMDDDDDEDNNENGEEGDYDIEGNKTSLVEASVAGEVGSTKKNGGQRASREEADREDGHSHRGRREGTELPKRESKHGASSRRGKRSDKERPRSRSRSGSRVDGVGRSGDRSYSRGHRKSDKNGDDRTFEGRTRHRSSPDRRHKRAQDTGRDRDESDRRKRRPSRSSERDRKISVARRDESRERSREVRSDRDNGSSRKRRGDKDKHGDEDRDSRERRRKRSRSRERGESKSKGTSSSSRRRR